MSTALTPGQIACLKWLKQWPGLYTYQSRAEWDAHKPASIQSFHSLIERGLVELRERWFWHLTSEGEDALNTLFPIQFPRKTKINLSDLD